MTRRRGESGKNGFFSSRSASHGTPTPVAGVLVQLCCQLTGGEYTATTDAAGAYSFQVAPGSYYLVLQRGSADPTRVPAFFTIISQNFSLPTGDTERGLTLPAVHTLTVHVRDTQGDPLPGVPIQSTEAPTSLPFQLGTGLALREPSRSGGGTHTTDGAGTVRLVRAPKARCDELEPEPR
jgi:hypothetical protein